MNNRERFEKVCINSSRNTTRYFSTSFSLGVRMLKKDLRDPIHSIYGYVRFADEIVDTFREHDQEELLLKFKRDTWEALEKRISLNPIIHSFQKTVRQYNIDHQHITDFLDSMAMDLNKINYDQSLLERYILGSAEVVGLMCLHVFCMGNEMQYEKLKPYAMSLGSAFQKVNFLRDMQDDYAELGRTYFPNLDLSSLSECQKEKIIADIEKEFKHAAIGIAQLPLGARLGVHVAYTYYRALLNRIKLTPAERILNTRIRVPDSKKIILLGSSYVQHKMNLI